eukprot:TRINITY_DN4076_c0_g1_i1.p1 TRINITY_DN4076_c0_g1~~TRINITY_DN4076_c0_g1_i1.p1  ORF type:complete len:558 (-),score=96.34 TRINITY_DN4076_c0_g1_i1:140-1741(-)
MAAKSRQRSFIGSEFGLAEPAFCEKPPTQNFPVEREQLDILLEATTSVYKDYKSCLPTNDNSIASQALALTLDLLKELETSSKTKPKPPPVELNKRSEPNPGISHQMGPQSPFGSNYLAALHQLVALQHWIPILEKLSPVNKSLLWETCKLVPLFKNYNIKSFRKTINLWATNILENMASITILFGAVGFLKHHGFLKNEFRFPQTNTPVFRTFINTMPADQEKLNKRKAPTSSSPSPSHSGSADSNPNSPHSQPNSPSEKSSNYADTSICHSFPNFLASQSANLNSFTSSQTVPTSSPLGFLNFSANHPAVQQPSSPPRPSSPPVPSQNSYTQTFTYSPSGQSSPPGSPPQRSQPGFSFSQAEWNSKSPDSLNIDRTQSSRNNYSQFSLGAPLTNHLGGNQPSQANGQSRAPGSFDHQFWHPSNHSQHSSPNSSPPGSPVSSISPGSPSFGCAHDVPASACLPSFPSSPVSDRPCSPSSVDLTGPHQPDSRFDNPSEPSGHFKDQSEARFVRVDDEVPLKRPRKMEVSSLIC